jgi:hypothetical protein
MTGLISVLKLSCLKRLFHQIISDAVRESEYSSASVVDLDTVRCFVAFQSIGMPNNLNRNPSELLLVIGSSANDASDAPKNMGSVSASCSPFME